ncbi:response regulator [Ovoidimarina sediminis]|uniref:response regulator n=1 Tax=Ovoidimarina sediminis TaxID=3079856 RepID=UPI00290ADF81|nr:response regulator [Rhodophyticola sp. MJ-SS7]MDU8944639.1 response regulator [Rhodophyticola sp. MJ-SS7]
MTSATDLSSEISSELPFLRRYARALTGSQQSGDNYAVATLEALIADPKLARAASSVRVGLYRTFHGIWTTTGEPVADGKSGGGGLESRAHERLSRLASNTREALLLKSVETFSVAEIAEIIGTDTEEARHLVDRAFSDLGDMVTGNVMIIEDEAIIAMDLESIVSGMGHLVTGVARTYDGAVALADKEVPDLILADIQLADKSSGIDAVNTLLEKLGERPVIFITAFPERLLTGERPEPAFLITKPYSEEQVRAAVSQAMFFATTEGLEAHA